MRDAYRATAVWKWVPFVCGISAIAAVTAFAGFRLTDPTSPVYTLGVAAGDVISLDQDAHVTGDLHSNGRVVVKEGARVDGGVSASGDVENRGTISGSVVQAAPPRTLPALLTEAEARALADRVFESDTTLTGTLDDVVFVHGNARLEAAVNGVGTVIASGNIEVEKVEAGTGPGLLQPGTRLSLIAFQHVKVHDNRSLRGALYAGHHVMIEKDARFEGVAVARQQVQIRQGAVVSFLSANPDRTPPDLAIVSPGGADVLGPSLPPIVVTYSDAGSGIALPSLRVELDGVSLLASCSAGPAGATCQAPDQAEGVHDLYVSVADGAGNRTQANRSLRTVLDVEPPVVAILSPADGALLNNASPQVSASLADAGSGIDTASVRLLVDDIDMTDGASITANGLTWTPAEPLSETPHRVRVEAFDRAGRKAEAAIAFSIDATPPSLTVEAPAPGLALNRDQVEVLGEASDDAGPVRVEVDGQPAELFGAGRFQVLLTLAEGAQTVTVRAIDAAGNAREESRQVTRFTLPEVSITSPEDLSFIASTTVRVSGTVSDPAALVAVNGVAAPVSGGAFTAEDVPLIEGGNVVTATATDARGHVGTDTVSVVRDLTAPRVVIRQPEDGARVFTPAVTVSGMVNDIVAGTVNASEATVTVNGRPAAVSNRSFVVEGVALDPGDNVLLAEAVDEGGNRGQTTITVRREATNVQRLAVVSGDLQEGRINTLLAQPLVVAALDAAGQPVVGRPILFAVRDGSGRFDGGLRQVAATTGADGRAQVRFTLGSRAGVAGQVVEASAVGFAGPAVFRATAGPGEAEHILSDAGTLQVGIAGQGLPRPFVAAVTDAGFNRLPGVEVRLRVLQGAGEFDNGLLETVVTSDSDGRILVPFTLGPEEGVANNVVEATIAGLDPSPKATFVASGRVAGDPAATSISGVVLDNSNLPVPGVTLRVKEQPQLTAQADAQGQFRIAGAPVGTIHLIVDGSTAARPGSWPDLEFLLTTVPGRDNTVNMPIFLLPIDVAGGIYVDETRGGTLTLPEFPGFALEVQPGSVTFPGGSRSGVISVTAVHGDKVPMVPNFGQQPRFIVTIQPAGARFEPPARLVLPNLEGLAPGAVTEMYSFDHDLGHFVSIGPGTVSEDSLVIVSDPGVGVIKAGWHCGGDPAAAGTPADCPSCEICNGSACVPGCSLSAASAASAAGVEAMPDLKGIFAAQCNCTTDNVECTVNDRCQNGTCKGDDVNVTAIQGPCAAPRNTPATFTATTSPASGAGNVRWTASGGSPATHKGASFSPQWSSLGDKTVQATCKSGKAKRVSILMACTEGVTQPTINPPATAPSIPPTFDGYFFGGNAKYTPQPCTNSPGDQYCVILSSFTIESGYALVSGKTDISSANDSDITASTCQAIVNDLTPSAASTYGQPPAQTYWSQSISEEHEQTHESDFLDMVINPTFNEFTSFLASQCQACTAASPDIQTKFSEIYNSNMDAFEDGEELRAYRVSNPKYTALADSIRARAQTERWNCQ